MNQTPEGLEERHKEFLKLHYEPEHGACQTCWCRPVTLVKEGVIHIEHNEQRVVLWDFIKTELSQQLIHLREKVDGQKKTGNNGKGLPFENSPEIYGNQRIESYKKGYNQALSDIISLIEEE